MSSLLELQRSFRGAVLGDRAAEHALLEVCRAGRNTPQQGLQAYRRGVHGQWLNALEASYPVLQQVVGADFFRAAARRYIASTSSVRGDLNAYGASLADFLQQWDAAQALPYLPDLARLEWTVQTVHDAADWDPCVARWQALAPEAFGRLRLQLNPAASCVQSPWAVGDIWRAHRQPGAMALEQVDVALPARELVVRAGALVQVRPLSHGEYAWYAALAAGQDLDGAVEAALACQDDFDLHAALTGAVREGLLRPDLSTTTQERL